jgi:protein-S-isoprenylcysteine O-methyltransferase Ste14
MAMTKTNKTLMQLALAGVIGAAIGALKSVGHVGPHIRAMFSISHEMVISVLLWCAFSLYWSYASKDSKPTASGESRGSRALHVFWVNAAFFILLLPVPGLTRRFLPASPWLIYTGLAIQAAFTMLAIWSRRHLGSNWSGEVRIAAQHQLVRSGPYRYIRHPIYTGVLGMYVGTCLVSGEIHAPVALLIVIAAYWRKIRMEERALGETFGAEFREYQRGTWAVVPLLY